MHLSADPEIDRILREPEGDTPRDHLELLSVLSNRITPAGIVCPPPTLGTYALLSCIRSPFLALPRAKICREDAAAALFILSCPKQAAELLLRRAVCEEQFSRAAESGKAPGAIPLRQTLEQERKFRKEWKHQLRRFERLTGPDEQVLRQIADELYLYLDPGIGFSMLPESDESGPQAFNLETVARIAAGLAEVMPGTATDRLLWEIPMVEIGMLLVQAARQHGMQGITRDEKTRRLWERFSQLQDPGKKSRTSVEPLHGEGKTARRHYDRIRNGDDLHRTPVRGGERRTKGIRGTSDDRRGTRTVTRHGSEPVSGCKAPPYGNGNRTGRTWGAPANFTASVPVSAGGPLQVLASSVVHIENILKHQLPESVV